MRLEKRGRYGSTKFWLFVACGFVLTCVVMPPTILNLWGADLTAWLLSRELKTRVEVEGWSGGWWGATEIRGLTIPEKDTQSPPRMLRVGVAILSPALPLWLFTARPLSLELTDVRVDLRRLENGQWNFIPLIEGLDTNGESFTWLPNRPVHFGLEGGSLFLETEDREYDFTMAADSSSVVSAGLQWRVQLRARNGESLHAHGQLRNLARRDQLQGSVDIDMSELDLGFVPVVLPALPVMYPDGVVDGAIRILLGFQGALEIQTQVNLRNLSLPDRGQEATAAVDRLEVRLAVQRLGNRWSADSFSIKGARGHLILKDRAWLTLGPGKLEGNANFALEVDDVGPVTQALSMLVPDRLSLSGRLSVEAQVAGEISHEESEPWDRRLAGLHANFRASLQEAHWGQDRIGMLVAEAELDQGLLRVSQASAKVGGGDLSLRGQLSLREGLPSGSLEWQLAKVSLQDMLGETVQKLAISEARGSITHDDRGYHATTVLQVPELALDPKEIGDRELRLTKARFTCAADLRTGARDAMLRDCSLQAGQGHLQLTKGRVRFAPYPELAGEVEGWLAGPFVNALVPELTSRLPERLRVAGSLGVPLAGEDVWQRIHWQLRILGQGFAWEGLEFEELSLQLNKTAERMTAEDIRLTRGRGAIRGAASFRVVAPGAGQFQLRLNRIPLQYRSLLGSFEREGPAALDTNTELSGNIGFQSQENRKLQLVADLHTGALRRQVRRGEKVVARAEIPPLDIKGTLNAADSARKWSASTMQVRGKGVSLDLIDAELRLDPKQHDVSGIVRMELSSDVAEALSLAFLPKLLDPEGTVRVSGATRIRIPPDGLIEPRHFAYVGEFGMDRLIIGKDSLGSLKTKIRMQRGRATIEEGMATLLDGEIRLSSPSFLELQGPGRPFKIHATAKNLALRTYGGQQFSLSKLLLLFSPLFLLEQKDAEPVDVSGILSGEIELSGIYEKDPGWSKSANGRGYLKIANGMVKGSTLISGFVTKTLLLPADLVQNSLESLFSREGKLGSELRGLGRREFVFGTMESPITIERGEIFLEQDLKVSSPQLGMVINGHSTLEGDVDYEVKTDLIERVRFGKITSLPNRIPVLGKFIRYLNPFTLLEGIELTARVKGNVFQKDATGGENIEVTTSLIR